MAVQMKSKLDPEKLGTPVEMSLLADEHRQELEAQQLLAKAHKGGWYFVCDCLAPGVRMTPVLLPTGKYTIRNLDEHAHDCTLFTVMGEGSRDTVGVVDFQQVASGGDRPLLFENGHMCRWMKDLAGRGSRRVEDSLPALAVLMRAMLTRAFSTFHVPYGRPISDAAMLYRIKMAGEHYSVEGHQASTLFKYGDEALAAWQSNTAGVRAAPGALLIWADLLTTISRDQNQVWVNGRLIECDVVWSFGWPHEGPVLAVMAWQAIRSRPSVCLLYPVERTPTAIIPCRSTADRVLITETIAAVNQMDGCYLERPMIPRWDADLTTVVLPPVLIVIRKSEQDGQTQKTRLAIWPGKKPIECAVFASNHAEIDVTQMTVDQVGVAVRKALSVVFR